MFKEELIEWSKKVRVHKEKLDQRMFDDLLKLVLSRLDTGSYEETFRFLGQKYYDCRNSPLVGPRLLGINAKLIKDKMWSINKKHNVGS